VQDQVVLSVWSLARARLQNDSQIKRKLAMCRRGQAGRVTLLYNKPLSRELTHSTKSSMNLF
jgi:hypothetical protein